MTDISPISQTDRQKFPPRDASKGDHAIAIVGAVMRAGPQLAAEVMTALLEEKTVCDPEIAGHYLDALRDAAEFWADTASPAAVDTYVAVGLKSIAKRRAFGVAAKKRLMVAIWNSFGPDDRRAFLAMAERGGND